MVYTGIPSGSTVQFANSTDPNAPVTMGGLRNMLSELVTESSNRVSNLCMDHTDLLVTTLSNRISDEFVKLHTNIQREIREANQNRPGLSSYIRPHLDPTRTVTILDPTSEEIYNANTHYHVSVAGNMGIITTENLARASTDSIVYTSAASTAIVDRIAASLQTGATVAMPPPVTGSNAIPLGTNRMLNVTDRVNQPDATSIGSFGDPAAQSTVVNLNPVTGTDPTIAELHRTFGRNDSTGLSDDNRHRPFSDFPNVTTGIPLTFTSKKAPSFAKDDDAARFLEDFGRYCHVYSHNPHMIVHTILPTCLTGCAKDWWTDERHKWTSLAHWEQEFQARWANHKKHAILATQCFTVGQHPDECVLQFLTRKNMQSKRYYPTLNEGERVARIGKLIHPKYSVRFGSSVYTTYDQLQALCHKTMIDMSQHEAFLAPTDFDESRDFVQSYAANKSTPLPNRSKVTKTTPAKSAKVRFNRDTRSRSPPPRSRKVETKSTTKSDPKTVKAKQAEKPRSAIKSTTTKRTEAKPSSSTSKATVTCLYCKKTGHYANECPSKAKIPRPKERGNTTMSIENDDSDVEERTDVSDDDGEVYQLDSDDSPGDIEQTAYSDDEAGAVVGSDSYSEN